MASTVPAGLPMGLIGAAPLGASIFDEAEVDEVLRRADELLARPSPEALSPLSARHHPVLSRSATTVVDIAPEEQRPIATGPATVRETPTVPVPAWAPLRDTVTAMLSGLGARPSKPPQARDTPARTVDVESDSSSESSYLSPSPEPIPRASPGTPPEPGLDGPRFRSLCAHPGCRTSPSFDYPSRRAYRLCAAHRLEGMVNHRNADKRARRARKGEAGRAQRTWGQSSESEASASDGGSDLESPGSSESGHSDDLFLSDAVPQAEAAIKALQKLKKAKAGPPKRKRATYAEGGDEPAPKRQITVSSTGRVYMRHGCEHEGCEKSANYGAAGRRSRFCWTHMLPGMMGHRVRRCAAAGCSGYVIRSQLAHSDDDQAYCLGHVRGRGAARDE
ncbi:hypothetical protein DFJ74DRAFT_409666 [Hyaloraphidium curvatum]|nr:hypothetical protein DFJ74DRAFT_409666 [Hyaloraphidium curvatum]